MSDQTPQVPAASPQSLPEQKSKKKLKLGLLLLAGLAICALVVLVIVYILASKTGDPLPPVSYTNSQNDNTNNSNNDNANAIPTLTSGKLFYIQATNIYSYNSENGAVLKLTNYPANPASTPAVDADGNPVPSISLVSLQVIDGENLGFIKCAIITGDFGCSVNVLALATNTVTAKKTLGVDDYALSAGFYSANKFAYLYTNDTKWRVVYNNAGDESFLTDTDVTGYGRGGFAEDSQKIRFSPDGSKVLQIATSSPISSTDFNVYVHDLSDFSLQTIAHATQPEWLDNNKIVYRVYNNADVSNNGLAIYDLSLDTIASRIGGTGTKFYNPIVLKATKKIVYHDATTKQVLTYDIDTAESQVIANKATTGLWIDGLKIAYYQNEECTVEEDCAMEGIGSLIPKSLDIFDLTTNSSIATTISITDVQTAHNFATDSGSTW